MEEAAHCPLPQGRGVRQDSALARDFRRAAARGRASAAGPAAAQLPLLRADPDHPVAGRVTRDLGDLRAWFSPCPLLVGAEETDDRQAKERQVADGVWRATRRKAQPLGFREFENSSTTMAFSRLPPLARPAFFIISISRRKQKVQPRHLRSLRSEKAKRKAWSVTSGCLKSTVNSMVSASAGSRRASLSVADLDGPLHDDELLPGGLLGDAALPDEGRGGQTGAVENGQYRDPPPRCGSCRFPCR